MSELKITKEQIEGKLERTLVSNCIMSTRFLSEIVKIWKADMAKTPFSREVMGWCVSYYHQYGVAPEAHIQDIYMAHRLGLEDTVADTISLFLSSISNNYIPPTNMEFTIQSASDYLRLRAVEIFQDKLKNAVGNKDFRVAEDLIANFTKAGNSKMDSIEFTNMNSNLIGEAFDQTETVLFRLGGALGKLIGDVKRTDFINILAPAKMGKSWALQHMGITAMVQGCNVLEIQLEMNKLQRIRRWWSAVNCAPKKDMELNLPYFYQDDKNGPWKIGHQTEYRKAVRYSDEAVAQFYDDFRGMYPKGDYRIQTYHSKSISVKDVRQILTNLEVYEGWKPDVVIIDHAFLLKFQAKGEQWEVADEAFAEMRGLATEFGIALLTATHSTRAGYKASMLDETQVGRSIAILNHITTGIAITATKAEREQGILRATSLVEREGSIHADQVVILQSLDLGLFHSDSRFLSELEYVLPNTEKDVDTKGNA